MALAAAAQVTLGIEMHAWLCFMWKHFRSLSLGSIVYFVLETQPAPTLQTQMIKSST
jgi:hypothetical protein